MARTFDHGSNRYPPHIAHFRGPGMAPETHFFPTAAEAFKVAHARPEVMFLVLCDRDGDEVSSWHRGHGVRLPIGTFDRNQGWGHFIPACHPSAPLYADGQIGA